MMIFLRVLVALILVIVVATYAFGQTPEAGYDYDLIMPPQINEEELPFDEHGRLKESAHAAPAPQAETLPAEGLPEDMVRDDLPLFEEEAAQAQPLPAQPMTGNAADPAPDLPEGYPTSYEEVYGPQGNEQISQQPAPQADRQDNMQQPDAGQAASRPSGTSMSVDQLPRTRANDIFPREVWAAQQDGEMSDAATSAQAVPSIRDEDDSVPLDSAGAPPEEQSLRPDNEEDFVPATQARSADPGARPAQTMPTAQAPAMGPQEVARYGVLTLETGGFADNLWLDVTRARADVTLSRMAKNGLKSRSARSLLNSMLLTRADPPVVDNPDAEPINWLAERVHVLHKLGMVADARRLLEGAGIDGQDMAAFRGIDRAWVENALMTGRVTQGCEFVRAHILNTDDPFWRRALLTCQVLQKDMAGLGLSMEMLTAAERNRAPLLFDLLDAVRNDADTGPRLTPDTRLAPLTAVVYAYFPKFLSPDVILRLPDTLLRQVAYNPTLDISMRLQAAEKLVNDYSHKEDIAELSRLYDKVDFDDKQVRSPNITTAAENMADGSMARAMMWQAAKVAGLPSQRALVLRALWERAEADGLIDLPAALTPNRRNVPADPNLAWFSPYVIENTLRSGNLAVARQWWQVLQANRSLSQDLTHKRTDLALAFGVVEGRLSAKLLDNWWASRSLNTKADKASALRTLTILEANNLPVPDDIWFALHSKYDDTTRAPDRGPGPLWLRLVGTSMEKGQLGTSLFLLMEPLVHIHPAEMAPQGVANIITGLRFLGMDEASHQLSMEALLHPSGPLM